MLDDPPESLLVRLVGGKLFLNIDLVLSVVAGTNERYFGRSASRFSNGL
jgi:hypothetical protein